MTPLLEAMRGGPTTFSYGLEEWLHGDRDDLHARAAVEILSETILMHRAWLKAHEEQ
jgi:hypothetical protein